MDNLKEETQQYNNIPVFYCRNCLSLRVKSVPNMEDCNYCDECSSTDIEHCSIEEWENKYVAKYGHKYLESYNNNYGKEH